MTTSISYVLSSISMVWVFLSIVPESSCRASTTGRSIKWYPESDDFSSGPFDLNLLQGSIIEFVCKPEYPMSFYRVEREDYFSCRKNMHSVNVGSCKGSNNKVYQTLRSDANLGGITWKPDTYYIIAVDNDGKRQYCKEGSLKMALTVTGADQPKIRTTTELIPEDTIEFGHNPNTLPEIKSRNSRDRISLPRLPERFNREKILTSQEILNGRLRFVPCIGTSVSKDSGSEKESTRKKGAACIMLNPSYYTDGKATDLMDTRYLPLYGSGSGMSSVVLPILVALFLL